MCAKQAAATYRKKNDDYFFSLIGLIACLGAAISIVILILNLVNLGITLSAKSILIILLVDAALVFLPFYLVATNKNNSSGVMRFGTIVLAALMLFINLFATSYLSATSDFLDNMSQGVSEGYIEYSIIAKSSAGLELPTNKSVRAGIQNTDAYKSEAEYETKKLVDASFTEFNNISEMIDAIEGYDLDIAVVQQVMLDAYSEYFPESYDKLDVLATFKTGTEDSAGASNAKVDITKPFSVYVSGIDEYGDIQKSGGRSDANMIVLVDPEHYKMLLINTPRDFYVQLHDTVGYKDKLTHAGTFGIEMSEQTLEDLYDFEIDYHVLINFTTIATFVESMGGIHVDNPRTFELWGQTYREGHIWLNGEQSVLFSRARKGLANGDFDRGENQQRVIEGIIDRVTDPAVVVHYKKLIKNLSGTFLTNMPGNIITQLFSRQISLGGSWTIIRMGATGTPAERPTYSMGGDRLLSVEVPDESSVAEIRAAIRDFMSGNG